MDISSAANTVKYKVEPAAQTGLGATLGEGLQGMRSAGAQLHSSAHSIATSYTQVNGGQLTPSQTEGLATDLINQRQAQLLFSASAEVVSVADELAGKLLDEIV